MTPLHTPAPLHPDHLADLPTIRLRLDEIERNLREHGVPPPLIEEYYALVALARHGIERLEQLRYVPPAPRTQQMQVLLRVTPGEPEPTLQVLRCVDRYPYGAGRAGRCIEAADLAEPWVAGPGRRLVLEFIKNLRSGAHTAWDIDACEFIVLTGTAAAVIEDWAAVLGYRVLDIVWDARYMGKRKVETDDE